jgi:hypothetical protein
MHLDWVSSVSTPGREALGRIGFYQKAQPDCPDRGPSTSSGFVTRLMVTDELARRKNVPALVVFRSVSPSPGFA